MALDTSGVTAMQHNILSLTSNLLIARASVRLACFKARIVSLPRVVVRTLLFFVMYWLRFPVMFICNLVFMPMLLAFFFAWYAFPDKTNMVWGFGTASFLAFFVKWSYDFILVAISPEEVLRSL